MRPRGPVPKPVHDVLVVGGGAAGIGVAVALKHAGIERFLVLERFMVGASFALWPEETRFITPSFPTNSIGMLDLNAIALGTSPATMMEVEHPTGEDYAAHLIAVAKHFQLPIRQQVDVSSVSAHTEGFSVETSQGTLLSKHVIWAAGEFQYPRLSGFSGSEVCRHTATIPSYENLRGEEFVIIGGYESGIDAAFHLAERGKQVRVLDKACPWRENSSDPSVALSTFTLERMRSPSFKEKVTLHAECPVYSVVQMHDGYKLITVAGKHLKTRSQPLLAGGFDGSHRLIAELFRMRTDGFPELTEEDESTLTPGLFLCGPSVRHDEQVFCFIYKFRQRFAVVAKAIAVSLGLPADYLESYRPRGMYLDDLSCCGEECVC